MNEYHELGYMKYETSMCLLVPFEFSTVRN